MRESSLFGCSLLYPGPLIRRFVDVGLALDGQSENEPRGIVEIMSRPSPASALSGRRSRAESQGVISDADIRNFAPVARIMKTALPENAKIAKEAKECMQECVSEFISFITSEGTFVSFFFDLAD